MAENKEKITIKELKEQIIMPLLAKTSFRYRVLTTAGAYAKAFRVGNMRVGTITAFMELTESEIMMLSGGLNATALNATIRFLCPVDDAPDENGCYPTVDKFREEITAVLAVNGKMEITLGEGDNKQTFIGALTSSFPIIGDMDIRQEMGACVEFVCYMQFAYLKDAVNGTDVTIYFGDDEKPIPYTQYSMSRKSVLTANLYSNSQKETAQTYAESSTFGIDLSMPALTKNWGIGNAVASFLRGKANANEPFKIRIVDPIGGVDEQLMIFGEVTEAGQGTTNVTWQISFVPYLVCEEEVES